MIIRSTGFRKKSTYSKAVDFNVENMVVELEGITDDSDDAESRGDRLEKLIAKVILLGQTRGRPRKEIIYEETKAA